MIRVLLDTNVLRYYGSRRDASQYKFIKPFWDDVRAHPHNYKLYIAQETFRELVVQMPVIERTSPKAAVDIQFLLDEFEIIPTPYDHQIEHKLRQAAAHVKAKFSIQTPKGKEMEYPSASDARILLTAYKEDLRLVTKNIKDFMLYPCLDGVLWDSETNTEVVIDEATYLAVQQHPHVISLIQDLNFIRTP